jgi:hypothetical protein
VASYFALTARNAMVQPVLVAHFQKVATLRL